MNVEDQIMRLLNEHGATLERTKKHRVWRFPDGRTFVQGCTPSDQMAARNNLQDLHRVLGIAGNDGRGTPGERRPKKRTQVIEAEPAKQKTNTKRENALTLSGQKAATLDEKISAMLSEMRGQ